MPPITNTQQNAIDKTKITTNQLDNPTPTPNLPTSSSFDFSQYLTPSPIQLQDLNTAEQSRDSSLENLTSAMFGNESQGARTLSYEEQAGIPTLQKQLREVENQLTQTDLNFRREREKIQTETGLTVGQRNARLADVSRKQASQLADLEVIRAARSGVLSDAQSFVQRKTELEFADEKARIDNLKFIYENNEGKYKDALGKVIKTEERAFDLAKSNYEQFENAKMLAIQNASMSGVSNGTLSAIQQSKDMNDLTSKFGKYFTDPKSRAELSKINMEITGINERNRKIKSGEIVLDKEQQDAAFKLQDDYENASKVFKDQVGAYNRILASAEDPSAAGDLALIFNYMKMLDPGSTVREGEFANAQNAAGIPEILRAKYNQAQSGQRLSDTTRADFIDRSEKIYTSAAEQQKLVDSQFRTRSGQFNIPAEVVVRDLYSIGQTLTQQTKDATEAQKANPWHSPLVPPQPIYNPSNNVWNIPQT